MATPALIDMESTPGTVSGPASFKRRIGLILTMAGFAVGLGNVWRFPYFAATYGGGAFVLTYVVLLLTFGLTLMIAEVAIGRRAGKTTIGAYALLHPKAKTVGVLAVLVSVIILPYYSVIAGWVAKYAWMFVSGQSAEVYEVGSFAAFTAQTWAPIGWMIFFVVINAALVHAGVQKGIERLNTIAMPTFVVVMLALTVYGLTLEGAFDGLHYYLVPNWDNFSHLTVIAASRQIFFSVGLAWGVVTLYGAYMNKKDSIEKASVQITIADTVVALLAGFMVIPMVTAVMGSEALGAQGAGMLFNVMPQVFAGMPGGAVVGAFFFPLMFIAALTSSVSMLEVPVAGLMEKTGWSRGKTVWISAAGVILLAIPSSLGHGIWSGVTPIGHMGILGSFSFIAESVFMPVVGLATVVFIGWVVGPKVIEKTVRENGQPFRFYKPFVVMTKWVLPILLTAILVTSLMMAFGALSL